MILSDGVEQHIISSLRNSELEGFGGRIYIAYSGGLDSSVLLTACLRLREAELKERLSGDRLAAWHINHGISSNANQWEKHCAEVCASAKVKLLIDDVRQHKIKQNNQNNQNNKESVEMFARRARYQLWEMGLSTGDILLQAHHLQDQAEHLLMRILRASPNLTGIPSIRVTDQGAAILRPLLQLDKNIIADYAKAHNVQHINDESNDDKSIDRNFIRHEILPKLSTRWPSAVSSIAESAELLSEYHQLNELEQQRLMEQFCVSESAANGIATKENLPDKNFAPRKISSKESTAKRENDHVSGNPMLSRVINLGDEIRELNKWQFILLIRGWLKEQNISAPPKTALVELHSQVSLKQRASLEWKSGKIYNHKNKLYALPLPAKE